MTRPRLLFVLLTLAGGARTTWANPIARGPASAQAAGDVWEDIDLDGDGKVDPIEVAFRDGERASCRIGVHLSRTGKMLALPFDMERDRRRFQPFVQTGGGERDEPVINMEIETQDERPLPIPAQLRTRYGIRSHHIAVHLAGRSLRIENLKTPPRAHRAR